MGLALVINQGVQQRIVAESPAQAGTTTTDFVIQSDAVLVTLYAPALSGTIDVSVYSVTDGQEALLFTFPQLTVVTPNVLLRRSSIAPENIRVRVVYSAACTYEIQARAVGVGSSDTRMLGQSVLHASHTSIGTSASVLIPATFTDRAGLIVRNNTVSPATSVLYIAESAALATVANGYPLYPKEALSMDIAGGTEIWAITDTGSVDVRILEAGQ